MTKNDQNLIDRINRKRRIKEILWTVGLCIVLVAITLFAGYLGLTTYMQIWKNETAIRKLRIQLDTSYQEAWMNGYIQCEKDYDLRVRGWDGD